MDCCQIDTTITGEGSELSFMDLTSEEGTRLSPVSIEIALLTIAITGASVSGVSSLPQPQRKPTQNVRKINALLYVQVFIT